MSIGVKAALGVAASTACVFILLFASAGALSYWQGWLFFAGFSFCTVAITIYFYKNAPDLLARRMAGGPQAERETSQRIIQSVNAVAVCSLFVVAGLDRRYGWSSMPAWLSVAGFAAFMAAMVAIAMVGKQNHYMAATVTVEKGQNVVDTGFYAWVRHPMYAAFTWFLAGSPLALASWPSFVPAGVVFCMLLARMHYEERFLLTHLAGYAEYRAKVRYRLFPRVF